MGYLQVLLIAVALAADAFAVSIAEGMALRSAPRGHALRVGVHFGAFQAFMPVLGWCAGRFVQPLVEGWDHWVAFGLLTLIGGKMVADSLLGFETGRAREASGRGRLLALSVATSMDALAVGLSLAMLGVRIWRPAAVVGLVTAVLCTTGVRMGDRIGARLGRWAEVVGGVVLCGIGLRILLKHIH